MTYTVASWQFETEDGFAPRVTFRCCHQHKTVRAAGFCLKDCLNSPLDNPKANEAFLVAPWTRKGIVRTDGKIEKRARETA